MSAPAPSRRAKVHAGGSIRKELEANVELARYCRALALPVRIRILRMLIREHCMFGDLSKRIPLAQSTISQHMKILANAGLVVFESVGQSTCWCVSDRGLATLKSMVTEL